MKKTLLILSIIFIGYSTFFARDITVSHVPSEHSGIIHINYEKLVNSVNIPAVENMFLQNLKILLPSKGYAKAEKVFKQIIPELKEMGFDIYHDITGVVISFGIKNAKELVVGITGNFDTEAYNKFMVEVAKAKKTSINNYQMYSVDNGRDKIYYYRQSKGLILISGVKAQLIRSIHAIESGDNILKNKDFSALYNRSIKNKAINIVFSMKSIKPRQGTEFRRRRGMRQSRGNMFLSILRNLDAVSINFDFPSRVSLHLRIYCSNPNTASQIGMMAQQQLPNLPTTITQELFTLNRRIAALNRKMKQGKAYLKKYALLLKHKKFFLLLASYAGRRIRVKTVGTLVSVDFFWPRHIVNSSIKKAELNYNLNRLLK